MPVDCFFMTMTGFRFGWSNVSVFFFLLWLFTLSTTTKIQWKSDEWGKYDEVKLIWSHFKYSGYFFEVRVDPTSCWRWLFPSLFHLLLCFFDPLNDSNLFGWCYISFVIFIAITTAMISHIGCCQHSFHGKSLMFMRMKFNKCYISLVHIHFLWTSDI